MTNRAQRKVRSSVVPINNIEADIATSVNTTCPYCGVGCGVVASCHTDGKITVSGNTKHPANYGRLCSKGSDLAETLGDNNRLKYPMVGGRRATWDDALAQIADKFLQAIENFGPDSVAFYVSGQLLTEDYYVANKLMKGYIGSANIDTNSRLCMASSVAGHRRAFGADTVPGCYEDLELADLVILTGSNLAWCHPVLFQRLQAARNKRPSMRIVVIDPRKTMTAQAADLHLAIQPDSDTALFTGLMKHLVDSDCLDNDYIEQYTTGFSAVDQSVDVDEVAKVTGIDTDTLLTFYQWFETTNKTVTVYSQGVNQSVGGTDKVNAIINCHLATGRIGKPGAGPFSITGQPNAMGGREVGGLANMLACHMDIENPGHREIVQNFWQSPSIATAAGLKAVELFDAVASGQIKALWIMATNPADSLPNANKVVSALKGCPFVVVSDVVRNTDTLQFADIALPALAWGEKDGTVTNSERLISRQSGFKIACGEAKPDWWALSQVASRMGYASAFNYQKPADIFREYATLSAVNNSGSRDFDIGALAQVDDDDYQNLSPFYWPRPASLSASISYNTEPDSSGGHKRFFSQGGFFHADQKARFVAVSAVTASPANRNYPLLLNTGRIRDQWHTMTRTGYSARLSAHIGEPFVEINSADADHRKIQSADLISIESELGSIVVRALCTDRVAAGQLFVPMHWTDQFASSARVDSLVPAVVDPVSGQPASKNVAVELRKRNFAAYGFYLSKTKPPAGFLTATDYWAIAPCEGGWRVEFALERWPAELTTLNSLLPEISDAAELVYEDTDNKRYRQLVFADGKLQHAMYLAGEPVQLSRNWLVSQLLNKFDNQLQRHRLAAGVAGGEQMDIGAIVCSCFSVGVNQITGAASVEKCRTVDEIGKATCAGTNCGSCRGEIEQLLREVELSENSSSMSVA